MFDRIQKQAESAVRELLEVSKLRPGDLLVIGCSSSEIMGERIGKGSSMEFFPNHLALFYHFRKAISL